MPDRIKIGISSCLLGENVRYDGGHILDHYLSDTLGKYVEWVSVCPEVEYGLPVPREAMHLVGDPDSPRLITRDTGIDHTDGMMKWAAKRLKQLEGESLCGFVFKSKSPSSGLSRVKVYSKTGVVKKNGSGLFAGAFVNHFPLVPVEDSDRLDDPILRKKFIERVVTFRRSKKVFENGCIVRDLKLFHAD